MQLIRVDNPSSSCRCPSPTPRWWDRMRWSIWYCLIPLPLVYWITWDSECWSVCKILQFQACHLRHNDMDAMEAWFQGSNLSCRVKLSLTQTHPHDVDSYRSHHYYLDVIGDHERDLTLLFFAHYRCEKKKKCSRYSAVSLTDGRGLTGWWGMLRLPALVRGPPTCALTLCW